MIVNNQLQQNQSHQFFKEKQQETAAFVLCHSIDSTLSPISKEFPPCLFPLCNIPVLFYVLNWLNTNVVNKIFLVCQDSQKNIIQKYTNQWQNSIIFKPIEILSVSEQNYQISSVGDSIRWIYSSSSIVLNFKNCIIIPGTTVTNIQLDRVLREHEKRMKRIRKDRGKPILTTVFTETPLNGYSALLDNDGSIRQIDIPTEINFDGKKHQLPFTKTKTTHIKNGLKDAQIYICAPELMGIFASDNNFDWNSIIDDCVPSIIDCEIDKRIVYASIHPDSFSSNVQNIQNYIDSSFAVIHHRLSPINIEANLSAPSRSYSLLFESEDLTNHTSCDSNSEHKSSSDDFNDGVLEYDDEEEDYDEVTSYKLEKDFVYIDCDVNISQSAIIGPSVVIGRGCQIEDGCIIKNSVIGNDCTIKKGCVIENSIIWDCVSIDENVKIDHSLIASNVLINKDIKINFGNILSFNLIVEHDIPPCRRLTAYKIGDNNEKEIDFRSDDTPIWLKNYVHNKKPLPLSNDGDCFEYIPSPESEIPSLYLWYQLSPNTFPIDFTNLDSIEQDSKNTNNENNMKSYESEFLISLDLNFIEEAIQFLSDLLDDSITIDQICSEFVIFKNSKYAENIDCAISIAITISKHWKISELQDGFDFLGELFNLFLSDLENQENLLFYWQEYCAKSQKRTDLFNHGMESFIELGSVSSMALKNWESEQEECNQAQLDLFNQYKQWEYA